MAIIACKFPGMLTPLIILQLFKTGCLLNCLAESFRLIQWEIPSQLLCLKSPPGSLVADQYRFSGTQGLHNRKPKILSLCRQYKNMVMIQRIEDLLTGQGPFKFNLHPLMQR